MIVAWIVHVVVSLVWFQPVFFGKAWTRLSGKEPTPAALGFPLVLRRNSCACWRWPLASGNDPVSGDCGATPDA